MLELIVIVVVMVYIVLRLDARHFEEAKSQWGLGAAPVHKQGTHAAPAPRPRLAIDGTQRPPVSSFKFVKGFGVNPQRLADLRIYTNFGRFEQFPESIRALLAELHRSGCTLGTNIMELMFHGRGLADNEVIYFALVEDSSEPHVVAFVDRLRVA